MTYVVDGADWDFDGRTGDEVVTIIETFLEHIFIANERSEKIYIGDDLQTRCIVDGMDLWTLCGSNSSIHISQELRNELAAWLSSALYYADYDLPAGMDDFQVNIDETVVQNADVAWAHQNLLNGVAVACLGINRRGPFRTSSKRGAVVVHWVTDEETRLTFWRSAIDIERDCPATLERLAPHAYPNLYFATGVWQGLQTFTGGYQALRQIVRKYLDVFNDEGAWVFMAAPPALRKEDDACSGVDGAPSNHLIQQRFAALQLNMAPEKPEVRKTAASRLAREIVVNGRTLYCEWHGKFEGHQNRVYVHPPVPETGNKFVVGIFHRHL